MQSANERRLALLEKLCARRYDKIENLAFEFGVDRRTIERDVELLSISHPIYTTKGTGGGVHIMEGYDLYRKYLTDKQCKFLEEIAITVTGDEQAIVLSILKEFSKKKELCQV